jgi:hypothetical protein
VFCPFVTLLTKTIRKIFEEAQTATFDLHFIATGGQKLLCWTNFTMIAKTIQPRGDTLLNTKYDYFDEGFGRNFEEKMETTLRNNEPNSFSRKLYTGEVFNLAVTFVPDVVSVQVKVQLGVCHPPRSRPMTCPIAVDPAIPYNLQQQFAYSYFGCSGLSFGMDSTIKR